MSKTASVVELRDVAAMLQSAGDKLNEAAALLAALESSGYLHSAWFPPEVRAMIAKANRDAHKVSMETRALASGANRRLVTVRDDEYKGGSDRRWSMPIFLGKEVPVEEVRQMAQEALDALDMDDIVEIVVRRILMDADPRSAVDMVVSMLETDDRLC